MASDPELRAHRDWLNMIQPVGLVVSPPALLAGQAILSRDVIPQQQRLISLVSRVSAPSVSKSKSEQKKSTKPPPCPLDFLSVAQEVLDIDLSFVAGSPAGPTLPEQLAVTLPEFGETLRPTYAVQNLDNSPDAPAWQLLVVCLEDGTPLDSAAQQVGKNWPVSPHTKLERLLRDTGVAAGVLFNGHSLRLVYAPSGESSGHLTWPISAICEVQGRPLLAGLILLLNGYRLFSAPKQQMLLSLLKESRKYQSVVSTQLANQVLEALSELLRGFEAANEATKGRLLGDYLRNNPEEIYGGMLGVLLRLVFLLYAEERGLMSQHPLYVANYSLTGLFDKLRKDFGRFPDTMDHRFGAWAQLCVLFRMIHDGASYADLTLPARRGELFNPSRWPFLEGWEQNTQKGIRANIPKVPDGVVYRVLEKLLLLDGDRLSYRALDVEQIGSVYENMMGFRLERASEISIGLGRSHVVVGLESLLSSKGADRLKYLKENAEIDLTGKAADAIKAAGTVDALLAALARRISPLTPRAIAKGGLYLQPTDERRRSGSHYTPRELTEPIVRTTLKPILDDLGPKAAPEQILALKICDPAMGSGAFLVEACRQLGDALVRSWELHGAPKDIPPDEEPVLFARRQVAQRCLYGVDKNPFAVNLGKLSLWLATLAKGHSFTFLDHSLRHGDSLVGLSQEQIACFHWQADKQVPTIRAVVQRSIDWATKLRQEICLLSASDDDDHKRELLRDSDEALDKVRLVGDGVIACFFAGENDKARKKLRSDWEARICDVLNESGTAYNELRALVDELRNGEWPVPCFHWEVEYPEVFSRENPGFDAVVGNPPFAGKNSLSLGHHESFLPWLLFAHENSSGNSDLVAHFFRRGFILLRQKGTFGFIATNTLSQGDTRATGLFWIRKNKGFIYSAIRRLRWPGLAAVVVCVVHVSKGRSRESLLDGRRVPGISAFLFPGSSDSNPVALSANAHKCFQGNIVLGMGFTFDDDCSDATPLSEMTRLTMRDPRNQEVIFPYLGGEEINSDPRQKPRRYVINFGSLSEQDARSWPELFELLETKVKPERQRSNRENYRRLWWQFAEKRVELMEVTRGLKRVLVIPFVTKWLAPVYVSSSIIIAGPAKIFAFEGTNAYCVIQSRVHEVWARFFSSTLEDRMNYSITDAFETFPLLEGLDGQLLLESLGREYHDYRAALMIKNNEGLTATYNRFHDPDESSEDILKLRELHAAMDRAVLDAYGWTDIQPTCEFLLDYEEEESDDGKVSKRKKPWRYRWPDDIRDEVLGRLLALNAERAKEEAAAALASAPPAKGKRGKKSGSGQGSLI